MPQRVARQIERAREEESGREKEEQRGMRLRKGVVRERERARARSCTYVHRLQFAPHEQSAYYKCGTVFVCIVYVWPLLYTIHKYKRKPIPSDIQ